MKQEIIKQNLKQTEKGYDLIAEKFSETRKHFWRNLEFIKEYTQEGNIVLDFGCGNGRLLQLFQDKKIDYFGVDPSGKLIKLARKLFPKQAHNFIKINPTKIRLPFKREKFNTIYAIAIFHHLPSKEYRLEVTKELYRLLQKDGWIIVTIWDIWGSKKHRTKIFKNWWLKIIGQSVFDWNDCQITFTDNRGRIFSRYHHAFTKKELEKLFIKAGFDIVELKKIGGNIVLIGRK